nr:BamA/TamA family outer membrane protein [Burkholderiaceae bacterium]
SLGPRDVDNSPLGGNRRLNFSLEAYIPIPGADRTLRALTFVDAGQVWGLAPRRDSNGNFVVINGRPVYEDEKTDLGNLRYSVGIGVAWISPLGPLKLSYAYPLNRKPEDRVQRFQFQIGTGF